MLKALRKKYFLCLFFVFTGLTACSHATCGAEKRSIKTGVSMDKAVSTDRVKIYKDDGSLQCGQGSKIPVLEMQKELKGITVFSSENKNDGLMRIQLCGTPTGFCNVYEIDRKDLEAVLKLGFKEWTAE